MKRPGKLACLLLALVAVAAWRGARAQGAKAQDGLVAEAQGGSALPGAPNSAARWLGEARGFYEAGQFERAEESAKRGLASGGESAAALYLLGHICERRGKARESLGWFTRAAGLVPPRADDLRTVGLDYVLLNDYPDATHWLERAVTEDPRDAEGWYDLGRVRMMQEKMAAAEQALNAALRLQPRMAKAENNLGVVYEAENRPVEAMAAYRKAIDWQAGSEERSGQQKEGSAQTEEPSGQLKEQRAQPLLNLGTLLRTEQHAAEAVPLLREAASFAPENSKAHEQLARALEELNDLAAAVPEMQLAVRLAPGEARLHFELGQLLRRAGRGAEAERELRLSGQLYGTHGDTHGGAHGPGLSE